MACALRVRLYHAAALSEQQARTHITSYREHISVCLLDSGWWILHRGAHTDTHYTHHRDANLVPCSVSSPSSPLTSYLCCVVQDRVYWTDREKEAVYSANRLTGQDVTSIAERLKDPHDIVVFHELSQPQGLLEAL